MLLQRLREYADRGEDESIPIGYNLEPVRYWVELDAEGRFLSVVTAEDVDGKRPKRVPVPTLVRAAGVKAKLLVDNASYALGVAREGDKPERVQATHDAFVALARRCAEETGEPSVKAVLGFLDHLDLPALDLPADFDPKQTMGFLVDGVRPTDLPTVRSFWMGAAGEGTVMQCIVCGERRPAMERIQLRLKGIPGGQAGGLALISANAGAFTSYGLNASYVAPTCQECSDQFMKAANMLLRDEGTHLAVGDSRYIFWTREPTTFSFGNYLSQPSSDQVGTLLASAYQGRAAELDATPFYATAFTASGGRAVVRDWIETTVGQAQVNLATWFARQRIVGPPEDARPYAGVYSLARSTMRTGSKEAPPAWMVKGLVHAALSGGPLPWTLLYRAVERCRLERGVSRRRAALIKMVLLSQQRIAPIGGDMMVELDTSNREPAYLCGRLFAELEAAQHAALGDVGANIVDRYYGTASSAPATVFGRLMRGVQPHMARLRREKGGAYHAIDRRLQDIAVHLETFPTTLTLEKQGLFALGYYHQRQADRQARGTRTPVVNDNPGEEE